MPTFPKGHHAYTTRRENAKRIAQLAPDQPTPTTSTVVYAPDPMSVRGIPAVGRNCPGHINGTQPEHAATR